MNTKSFISFFYSIDFSLLKKQKELLWELAIREYYTMEEKTSIIGVLNFLRKWSITNSNQVDYVLTDIRNLQFYKTTLVSITDIGRELSKNQIELLTGIISALDLFMDYSVDIIGISESTVFPYLDKEDSIIIN